MRSPSTNPDAPAVEIYCGRLMRRSRSTNRGSEAQWVPDRLTSQIGQAIEALLGTPFRASSKPDRFHQDRHERLRTPGPACIAPSTHRRAVAESVALRRAGPGGHARTRDRPSASRHLGSMPPPSLFLSRLRGTSLSSRAPFPGRHVPAAKAGSSSIVRRHSSIASSRCLDRTHCTARAWLREADTGSRSKARRATLTASSSGRRP